MVDEGIYSGSYEYGYWGIVLFNVFVFVFFVLSYFKPKTNIDWRSSGSFIAFIIALFTEMYGFPLTIYLLSGWLMHQYPDIELFARGTGRLWQTLFQFRSGFSFYSFFVVSNLFIWGGIALLIWSWRKLYQAQVQKKLATEGPYSAIRHPQYLAFVLVMLGFLIQWPTIPTLVMFPILILTYRQLAKREERETEKLFGEKYQAYRDQTPAFFPHFLRMKKLLGFSRI